MQNKETNIKNKYEIEGDLLKIYIENKKGEKFTVLADAEDFENLSLSTWNAHKKKSTGKWYARTWRGGKHTTMHVLLMKPPKGMVVDHINEDGMCNKKDNLRIVTILENNSFRSDRFRATSLDK